MKYKYLIGRPSVSNSHSNYFSTGYGQAPYKNVRWLEKTDPKIYSSSKKQTQLIVIFYLLFFY